MALTPEELLARYPLLAELRRVYDDGDLVLLAGAGVSCAAGLPSWAQLAANLREQVAQQPGADGDLHEVDTLLGQHQYVAAITVLKDRLGSAPFFRAIQHELDDEPKAIPAVAEAIAALAPKLRYVLTTNLDRILERTLGWEGVVASDGDFAHDSRIVLKLHGTRRRPHTWIMTKPHYDRVKHEEHSTRQNIEAILRTRAILFVGFGLRDDHFDLLFDRLSARSHSNPPPSFALLPKAELPHRQRIRELASAGLQLIPYDHHDELPAILHAIGGNTAAVRPFDIPPLLGSRFKLLRRLGSGRTTTVFKARDQTTDRNVAVRVLHPHLALTTEAANRFAEGAARTRALKSPVPGLVDVHGGAVVERGFHFYAEELIEGIDLRRAVLQRRLDHNDICEIIRKVAECLWQLHCQQKVHGGVTPNNIIIDAGKNPWLTEMVVFDPYAAPLYRPPQSWGHPPLGPESDVYSLAMTMVFAFHGQDLSVDILRDLDEFIGNLACNADLRVLLGRILRVEHPGSDIANARIFRDPTAQAQWSPEDINRINTRRNIERHFFNSVTKNVKLGKFELMYRVGGGTFSEVHRARDTSLERDVALKLITASRMPNLSALRHRIRREAQALTQIRHPHVVEVYDYESNGNHPFIVLRFVEGQLLSRWLLDRTITWPQVIAALRTAGHGLQAIHDANLVHRDFKPGNIIIELGPEPKACIVDFGLAQPPGPPADGTPAYMAPEQARAEAQFQSDQFSFCASLYHALYGVAPFEGTNLEEIMQQIRPGPPTPAHNPRGVPDGILRILQRGMDYHPNHRYGSMNELLNALDAQVRAEVLEPTPLLWDALRGLFNHHS